MFDWHKVEITIFAVLTLYGLGAIDNSLRAVLKHLQRTNELLIEIRNRLHS